MDSEPTDQAPAQPPTLTVIVPVYNEAATVVALLERVLAAEPPDKQVLVVDDGSTDGTAEALDAFAARHPAVARLRHERNRGKGAAIRTALPHATGCFTIIQDADLEYDPADYAKLLAAAERGGVRVVYGSRIRGGSRPSHWRYYLGGRLVSLFASLLYGAWITDESTCYKLFDTDLLKALPLREDGFGFCPEVTALVRKRGERIVEVPIAYHPRRIAEGKKIRWHDGLEALWILLKHWPRFPSVLALLWCLFLVIAVIAAAGAILSIATRKPGDEALSGCAILGERSFFDTWQCSAIGNAVFCVVGAAVGLRLRQAWKRSRREL